VRRGVKFHWGLVAAMLTTGAPAFAAAPLVADLSTKEIAITTGFSGTELLLFGALDRAGDVVVVVRGPARREIVRRKQRIGGVWVNSESMSFADVPAYYRVASTRPLSEIARPVAFASRKIGAERLAFRRAADSGGDDEPAYRAALLRNKRREHLYSNGEGAVSTIGERLFRTTVFFPANVPTGSYTVEVYLFRDRKAVMTQRTPLTVHKIGLEADIFNFAHQQSALYGIIAIVIALMAGWLAGVMFRKT